MTNHLWQSTWFAVLVAMLVLALRKNRAQVRYWLWFSASVKFVLPFGLLIGLGSRVEWGPAAPAVPALSTLAVQIAEPFPETMPYVPSASSPTDWKPGALLAVWACGFAVIACIRLRGWLRIRAAVRASTPIDIAAGAEIRSSPGLIEPGVVGLWRPILLVPAGITERLTPSQLDAVLAHELCHVRRRDNLTAAIHMGVEAVFWFHPLVWWVGAKLVEERERACDEEVVRLGSEPRVYAEGILNVCKLYTESPLRCVSGVTGSDLKRRIEAIMTNRLALRLNFAKKAALAAAGVAVVSAPVVIGMIQAPARRAQPAVRRFEVAAVRACRPEEFGGSNGRPNGPISSVSPGQLTTGCFLLVDANNGGMIQGAYVRFAEANTSPFHRLQVSGGPDWVRTERFTISAKADGVASPQLMQGPMIQALLEERFKLKIRRETKEVPVYELTAGKDLKLKKFVEGSCTPVPVGVPLSRPEPGQRYCSTALLGSGKLLMDSGTLGDLANMLSRLLDRPVIDKTGIPGKFEVRFDFARDQSITGLGAPSPNANSDNPSIFTVIKELGLKLDPGRGPQEFLVIDHVERPSGN